MSRLLFLIIALFSLPSCAEEKNHQVRFIYAGFDFYVPSNPTVVGAEGGEENFTFFRFGPKKGSDYLAFTDITNESRDYGCSTQEFYAHLAGVSDISTCSKSEIDSFKKIFVGDSEVGEWASDDLASYYFYNKSKSALLIFSKEKIIKIDTDYLSMPDLKNILRNYL
jgi:hypothetical protein